MDHERLTQILTSTASKSTSRTYPSILCPRVTPVKNKTKSKFSIVDVGRPTEETHQGRAARHYTRVVDPSERHNKVDCVMPDFSTRQGHRHSDGHSRPQEQPSIRRPTESSRRHHTEKKRETTLVDSLSRVVSDARLVGRRSEEKEKKRQTKMEKKKQADQEEEDEKEASIQEEEEAEKEDKKRHAVVAE